MKILTINGSGTGGYRAAQFLKNLEEELGAPLHTEFDLITGESSGSIIGGMIASGVPTGEAVEKFEKAIPVIFSNPRCLLFNIFTTKYKADNLHSIVKENFDFKYGEMKTKFMTYAMCLDSEVIKPRHWKSWVDTELMAYHPIISSSTAPSYFPPYQFTDIHHGEEVKRTFLDGGTVINNPSVSALAEAISLGTPMQDIKIVNVGSGKQKGDDPDKYKGLLSLASRLPFAILASTERMVEYQVEQLIGDNCVNCIPDYMTETDSTDFDNFKRQADLMWETNKDKVLELLK